MRRAAPVAVTPAERAQLEAWARAGPAGGRLPVRAGVVLRAADGLTNAQIASRLGVHLETAARWRSRFVLNGLEGISREAPRAGAPERVPRSTVRRIVRATLAGAPAPARGWTTRSLARSLRVNHMLVHRVWAAHGLGNGRPRAATGTTVRPRIDLAGAFVTPRTKAVVFAVDDRPTSPAAERPLPELVPNPTLSAEFSGPEVRLEEVVRVVGALEASPDGASRGPATEASLLVFLRGVERTSRRPLRFEVVFDRPVSRLGRRAASWLASHPRFTVFTTSRGQRWSGAVETWLRRWEPVGLDRDSLGTARAFARQFPPARPQERAGRTGLTRFSWRPPTGPMSQDAWPVGELDLPPAGRRPEPASTGGSRGSGAER